jgi:multidrug resistance efflux pump
MKPETLPPIPVPLEQRWRDARRRLLPVVVFGGTLCAIACLWRSHVAAPTLVGQAEPMLANVSSHKPGILAALNVSRFQQVKTGDPIGQVMIADPKLIEYSLAVLRAENEMFRLNLSPIAKQQRNAVDYIQARLDWMRQRVTLASTRVNLQYASAELRRTEDLFKEKIVSQSELDLARTTQEGLQREVEELTRLVVEGEQNLKDLSPSNTAEIGKVSDEPMRAAIEVQEAKLRLTEAELSPITLRAPMDGMIATIYHHSGEAVTAGQPIVSIATSRPARIVGYLRPPLLAGPKVGTRVTVRTRGLRQQVGFAQIVAVSMQLETIPPVLSGLARFNGIEQGLPIDISLPANLGLHPGELVDITLASKNN